MESNHIQVFWDLLKKDMNLSHNGLIMLQMFEYFVVMAQYRELKKYAITGCPVKALAKLCQNYSKLKGIDIKWSEYYKKIKSLNIDKDAPLVESDQSDLQNVIGKVSKYTGKATPDTILKGIELLGENLPHEVKTVLLQWVHDPDSIDLEAKLDLVINTDQ